VQALPREGIETGGTGVGGTGVGVLCKLFPERGLKLGLCGVGLCGVGFVQALPREGIETWCRALRRRALRRFVQALPREGIFSVAVIIFNRFSSSFSEGST